MSVIYLVLPLAVVFSTLAVVAFIRAAQSGQFDDLKTPALRVLHDDQPEPTRVRRDGPDGRRRS